MKKLIKWVTATYYSRSKTPWASFVVSGFAQDGQIQVDFSWNDAFIKQINALGFVAGSDADSVQLFFYASQMTPTSLMKEDIDDLPVQASSHPGLGSEEHEIRT
jgi:hypothetical protein